MIPTPQYRYLHASIPKPQVPPYTTKVPDVASFLKLIGRNASIHATKLPTWEALFNSTSAQLKSVGVEPARLRKYIIWWRERYRIAGGEIELGEVKRGRKIDGGERRKKMVRAIRRTQEYREKKRLEEREDESEGADLFEAM